ncbi:MAG: response regulator [Candidatus Cloacimonadaceae bacterium]
MNKRILVAESEQYVSSMISRFLSHSNYNVVVADDGKDALDKVEMELFDLYLIDIYLPQINGLELMLRIREIQPLAVIILVTDYESVDVVAQALHRGAFHYLTKPIEEEELVRAVNKGLERSEEVEEVGGISPASMDISKELIDLLLLKGFSTNQQNEFAQLGNLVLYKTDEKIPLSDQTGTMIWVEAGRVSVLYGGNTVDTLRPGDIWGEETFIGTNSIFTELVVQADAQIRHFQRKKMLDYFAYHDESLIKRFMINLIQCLYFKWRKAIIKTCPNSGFIADPSVKESGLI